MHTLQYHMWKILCSIIYSIKSVILQNLVYVSENDYLISNNSYNFAFHA